jgi:hypothetical protein
LYATDIWKSVKDRRRAWHLAGEQLILQYMLNLSKFQKKWNIILTAQTY